MNPDQNDFNLVWFAGFKTTGVPLAIAWACKIWIGQVKSSVGNWLPACRATAGNCRWDLEVKIKIIIESVLSLRKNKENRNHWSLDENLQCIYLSIYLSIDGPDLESYILQCCSCLATRVGQRRPTTTPRISITKKMNTLITVSNFYFNVIG